MAGCLPGWRAVRSISVRSAVTAMVTAGLTVAAVWSVPSSSQGSVAPAGAKGAAPAAAPKANPNAELGIPDKIPEVEAANELLKKGKLDEALAELEKAFKKHPPLGPAEHQLGVALANSGNVQQARILLERAALKNPDNPLPVFAFGSLAAADGRLTDAAALFEQAKRLVDAKTDLPGAVRNRWTKDYHAGMAGVAEARADWKSAERHLRAWIALDKTAARPFFALARALFSLEEPKDAAAKEALVRAELDRAIALEPESEPADVTLARFYAAAKDKTRAAERITAAVKADEARPTPRVQLAYADYLLQNGKPAEALPYARRAADLDRENKLGARRLLGLLHRHSRNAAAAEEIFAGLYRDQPGDLFIGTQYAMSLVEQNDPVKRRRAMEVAAVMLQQHPRAVAANATAGWCMLVNDRIEDAGKLLRAAVSGQAADSDTGYYLAVLLDREGKLDEAKKILEQITKTEGGWVYRDAAVDWLKRLSPTSPPAPKTGG